MEEGQILTEVPPPPLSETPLPATGEETPPPAPETEIGLASTVGQLQVENQQLCQRVDVLQAEINSLRAEMLIVASEEFERKLAEVIQEEVQQAQEEETVPQPQAKKKGGLHRAFFG